MTQCSGQNCKDVSELRCFFPFLFFFFSVQFCAIRKCHPYHGSHYPNHVGQLRAKAWEIFLKKTTGLLRVIYTIAFIGRLYHCALQCCIFPIIIIEAVESISYPANHMSAFLEIFCSQKKSSYSVQLLALCKVHSYEKIEALFQFTGI